MEKLHNYQKLRKYCIKTQILKIDIETLKLFLQEDFQIPEKYYPEHQRVEDLDEKVYQELEDLQQQYNNIKSQMKFQFFKLEAKHPKDMQNWVSDLKFCLFYQVLLCLKNSDIYSDYIPELIKKKENVNLVFKKWYPLNKSMEFRCFVKNKKLIGVCQRNLLYYFDFLEQFYIDNVQNNLFTLFEEIKNLIEYNNCFIKRFI